MLLDNSRTNYAKNMRNEENEDTETARPCPK